MKVSEKKRFESAHKGANETFKSKIGDSGELNFSCLNIRSKNMNSFQMVSRIEYNGNDCRITIDEKGFAIYSKITVNNWGRVYDTDVLVLHGNQIPKELEKDVLKAFGYTFL